MKICINIMVWSRPGVFDATCRSIFDQDTEHEIVLACALSPDDPHYADNERTANRFAALSIVVPNKPLSTKSNTLARSGKQLDWDYWMVLGSDDVVGPGFFDSYDFDAHEAWGWKDLYMYEPTTDTFCHWHGYTDYRRGKMSVGAGRVVSRDIMERLHWMPHRDGLDRNLDSSMSARLKQKGVTMGLGPLPDDVYMVDCKDDVSITPMSAFDPAAMTAMPVPSCLRRYL